MTTPLTRLLEATKYFLDGYEDADDWQDPAGVEGDGWSKAFGELQEALNSMPNYSLVVSRFDIETALRFLPQNPGLALSATVDRLRAALASGNEVKP